MNEEKILVIIPTLNEELIIRKVISEIKVSFKNIDILLSMDILMTKLSTK